MSVSGKVHLVLHCLKELLSDGSSRVIVDAEGINLQHFAIKHLL